MYPKEDLRAELVIYCRDGLFNYNAAYLRDGGVPNADWESGGIFPSVHDALTAGREWWDDAKKGGYKKGSRGVPWKIQYKEAA